MEIRTNKTDFLGIHYVQNNESERKKERSNLQEISIFSNAQDSGNLEQNVNEPEAQTDNKLPEDNNPTSLIIQQLVSKKDRNGVNGVFIGDNHGDTNIQEFLVNQMPEFKKAGVNKFYMEMIRAENQNMIDRYYQTGDNSQEIIAYLTKGWNLTEGCAQRYFNIIRAAKENNIQVYGIDEPLETYLSSPHNSRLERSNPFWANIISNHTNSNDKYIVFGGQGHSANYSANKGVDQLLGIPSIDFDTSPNNKVELLVGDKKANDFHILLPK